MELGRILAFSIVLALGGCAVSGQIQSVNSSRSGFDGAAYKGETRLIADEGEIKKYPDSEQYRVFEQSATGYGSIPEARDQAMPRVVTFCRSKNREPKILKEETSVPPHILGNFPRIEITFVCVEKSDMRDASSGNDDRYSRLGQLKTLLDSGAITKDEYEAEKRKILME